MFAAHHWWRRAENFHGPQGPRAFRDAPHPAPGAPGAAKVVRLATYNIQLGQRLDRVARVLGREPALRDADILALQEADEAAVERLAGRDFGYAYFAASRHPTTGRNFGPALLSRWPILDHAKVELPGSTRSGRLLRVAVRTTLMVHGIRVRCYSIHLSTLWETSARGQDDQARAIVHDAEQAPLPTLVIGDLNRRGAAGVFQRHGYQWLTRAVGPTHYIWSFDHIFARGMGGAHLNSGLVATALEASDHKAVFAEITLCP
jgi:endonuclease/exonuclease/phosphatase family metal-dependent hydrolase